MTYATKAVYARNARNFSDKQGTSSLLYIPTVAQLNADSKALTYVNSALAVAPAEGWRLSQLRLINVTGGAVVASLWIGTAYDNKSFIGAISVPANAGYNGTVAAVNGLNTTTFPDLCVDNAGKAWYDIEAGKTLFITSATADALQSAVTIHDYAE